MGGGGGGPWGPGGPLPQGGLPKALLPHLTGKFSATGGAWKQHRPVHQPPVLVPSPPPDLPWFRDLSSLLPRAPPHPRLQKGPWPQSVRPPGRLLVPGRPLTPFGGPGGMLLVLRPPVPTCWGHDLWKVVPPLFTC